MLKTVTSILLVVAFGVSMGWFYETHVYKADVAKDWIDMAKVSNNLPAMNADITNAITILENYHGSPVIFPTPNQNYDVIKSHLQDVITTNNNFKPDGGNAAMSYQQLLTNHKTILDSTYNDMGNANENAMFNPAYNFIWIVFLVVPLPILILEVWYQERSYKRAETRRQKRYTYR